MLISPLALLTLFSIAMSAPTKSNTAVSEEIKTLLTTQAESWNRGDLVAFCAVYALDATFISPSGLSQGRDKILERYRAKYSTKEKMGTLSFEFVEVRHAEGVGASVILRWKLTYPSKEPASGLSLVVLHPTAKSWMIVQDASM